MTTAYQQWVSAGRGWTAATPIAQLADALRRHGYTVYILGDSSHLLASTPEDHTPYSATGWPVASPRGYVHALDIMPAGGSLPSLAALGAQLAADKTSGVATWVKYMNWSPAGKGCQHWSWEPRLSVTPSSDAGHIHLSIRSDATHTDIGGYDPVARMGHPTTGAVLASATTTAHAPAWPGVYYKLATPMMHGPGIATWQAQMHARGWVVTVDGWLGPQSDTVLRGFQREKGLAVDGILGPASWAAAWTAPVT